MAQLFESPKRFPNGLESLRKKVTIQIIVTDVRDIFLDMCLSDSRHSGVFFTRLRGPLIERKNKEPI